MKANPNTAEANRQADIILSGLSLRIRGHYGDRVCISWVAGLSHTMTLTIDGHHYINIDVRQWGKKPQVACEVSAFRRFFVHQLKGKPFDFDLVLHWVEVCLQNLQERQAERLKQSAIATARKARSLARVQAITDAIGPVPEGFKVKVHRNGKVTVTFTASDSAVIRSFLAREAP